MSGPIELPRLRSSPAEALRSWVPVLLTLSTLIGAAFVARFQIEQLEHVVDEHREKLAELQRDISTKASWAKLEELDEKLSQVREDVVYIRARLERGDR